MSTVSDARSNDDVHWKRQQNQNSNTKIPDTLVEKWINRFHRLPGERRGFFNVPSQIPATLAVKLITNDPFIKGVLAISTRDYCITVERPLTPKPDTNTNAGTGTPDSEPATKSKTFKGPFSNGFALARPDGLCIFFDLKALGGVPDCVLELLTNSKVNYVSDNFSCALDKTDRRLEAMRINVDLRDKLHAIWQHIALPNIVLRETDSDFRLLFEQNFNPNTHASDEVRLDDEQAHALRATWMLDVYAFLEMHSEELEKFAFEYQASEGKFPYSLPFPVMWCERVTVDVSTSTGVLDTPNAAAVPATTPQVLPGFDATRPTPRPPLPAAASKTVGQSHFDQRPVPPPFRPAPSPVDGRTVDVEQRFSYMIRDMIDEFNARFFTCPDTTWTQVYHTFYQGWVEKLNNHFMLPPAEARSKESRLRNALELRIFSKTNATHRRGNNRR